MLSFLFLMTEFIMPILGDNCFKSTLCKIFCARIKPCKMEVGLWDKNRYLERVRGHGQKDLEGSGVSIYGFYYDWSDWTQGLSEHILSLPNNIVLPMTLKCNYLKPSGKERTGQHVKWHMRKVLKLPIISI